MLNTNKDNQLALTQEILPKLLTPTPKLKSIFKKLKNILILGLSLGLLIFGLSITYIIFAQGQNDDSYSYTKKDPELGTKKFLDLSDIIVTKKTDSEANSYSIEAEPDDTEIIKANLITPTTTIPDSQNDLKSNSMLPTEVLASPQSSSNQISSSSNSFSEPIVPITISSSSSILSTVSSSPSVTIISSSAISAISTK